jgi:acid stress-induced BolA-like protein IbaG/YrbA
MPSPEDLKSRIEAAFPDARVEVDGDGRHFFATIHSERFRGLTRIAQHRLVYDVFEGELGGSIHALSLTTRVPEEHR